MNCRILKLMRERAMTGNYVMSDEAFKSEIREIIKRANIDQLSASIVLEYLAKEQRDEFDEADR